MAMPRVGIIGGSLGGLTAAVLLRDAGCEVDVYERASAPLIGFGAGIVVQPELVRYFVERTSITLDQISIPSSAIRYFNAASGRLIGEIDADWRYTSYNALYRGLLKTYGTDRYHLGEALVGLEQQGNEVELRFGSGRLERCELAVCADGGFSIARQRLLGTLPQYAGYITWRGVVPRDRLSEETWHFFDSRFTYGLLDDEHTITYPIPVVSDDLQVTDRRLNFQWYWNVPEGPELDEMMTDVEGIRRPVSVHAHMLQQCYVHELHERAHQRLQLEPLIELLTAAADPFVTVIADTATTQMVVGRVCLVGEAAVTVRPHAAAGGAKAAADAWALADALIASDGDVEIALAQWEPRQLLLGYALLAKVRYMASRLQGAGKLRPGDPDCRFGLPAVA